MENNKDIFQKAKVAVEQTAKELEEAERLDNIRKQLTGAEREAMEKQEKEAERLAKPAKIWIGEAQSKAFLKKGEVDIGSLDFGDRVLVPGEIVTLEDEQGKQLLAELISIQKTNTGNDKVKVKFPENK